MTLQEAPAVQNSIPADVLVGDPIYATRGVFAEAGKPLVWKNDTPESVTIISSVDDLPKQVGS
ncbi:MAG: hypothetical protein N2691_04825 [Patescibacteria group bacterium]|nr:hypothetical protein [Patescibacteria group bacterium]